MKTNLKKKMGGFVQTAELVLLSTVLVTGLTVGLVNLRDTMNSELEDVAESVGALNQSYEFTGVEATSGGGTNFVMGSKWADKADTTFPGSDSVAITYLRAASATESGS